ncbi:MULTISPECIES: prepilin peptidase [Mesonia]|uniref:Uncharacterized protein n=1 Tax=Mesonia oceanica TaxID=2687242 RepID=A0AC61Y878_9FLAO|nr:hypothetical protein FVB9532_00839 [Mesonia oceanica]
MSGILISQILIGVCLCILVYQDFKHRHIHIVVLIVLFLLSAYLGVKLNLGYKNLIYNVTFILINIVGLIIYYSIKSRKIYNPLNVTLGWGDVLFFFAISPIFSLKNFILFFILALILTLVFTRLTRDKYIPLAGYFSIYLFTLIFFKILTNNSFLIF